MGEIQRARAKAADKYELPVDVEENAQVLARRIDRYAMYLDDHILKINEMAEIIESQTGIQFSRF